MDRYRVAERALGALKAWAYHQNYGHSLLDRLGFAERLSGKLSDGAFIDRVSSADEDAFKRLIEYFDLDASPPDAPWGEPGFRLFISHSSQDKERVQPLLDTLSYSGIVSFLAHVDIEPGEPWQQVILQALRSMDALLSFHTQDFDRSKWCAQEIGVAIGRDVPIVSLRAGADPSGFTGTLQAVPWKPDNPRDAKSHVLRILARDRRSSLALSTATARKLKTAGSWDTSTELVDTLSVCHAVSEQATRDARLAVRGNDQVGDYEFLNRMLAV